MSAHRQTTTAGGTTFYFARPAKADGPDHAAMREVLAQLLNALDACVAGAPLPRLDLMHLDPESVFHLTEALGQGEVTFTISLGETLVQIRESAMPGIWRIRERDAQGRVIADQVEVAGFPRLAHRVLAQQTSEGLEIGSVPSGAMNALPILAEVRHVLETGGRHTISFTNLPLSPEDHQCLSDVLGQGPVMAESHGYSTSRALSTRYRDVWRVSHRNSDGKLIYDSIEVTPEPVAVAAPLEDIAGGRERLVDLMRFYG